MAEERRQGLDQPDLFAAEYNNFLKETEAKWQSSFICNEDIDDRKEN